MNKARLYEAIGARPPGAKLYETRNYTMVDEIVPVTWHEEGDELFMSFYLTDEEVDQWNKIKHQYHKWLKLFEARQNSDTGWVAQHDIWGQDNQ